MRLSTISVALVFLAGTAILVGCSTSDAPAPAMTFEEFTLGTDPLAVDSDSDGFRDGAEVLAGTDPLDANSHPVRLFANGFESGNFNDWAFRWPPP